MERKSNNTKEVLKTVFIDVDNGICAVNGKDISAATSFLNLTFNSGTWSLMITQDTIYIGDPCVKE